MAKEQQKNDVFEPTYMRSYFSQRYRLQNYSLVLSI
jgi:hypothetical protein